MKGGGQRAVFFCVSWKEEGVGSLERREEVGAVCGMKPL